METPNIQLYNLFRQDLHLTDGKSLELMHLLNKEYKSGVKEDIAALGQSMDARFQSIEDCLHAHDKRFDAHDKRFDAHDKRFDAHDKRFDALDSKIDKNFIALDGKIDKNFVALDNKIDLKTAELRTDIHQSHASIIKSHTTWMITLILAIIGMIIASFFKK